MLRRVCAFLSVCVVALSMVFGPVSAYAATDNKPIGDVGDYGTWLTQHNTDEFNTNLAKDIDAFQSSFQNQLVENYVPIEARLGMSFMNGLSRVGQILDRSLFRFVSIFMVLAYIFWVSFESYNMIVGNGNVPKTLGEILKKGLTISVWLIILQAGPARIFMWVVGPIIGIGTAMSDLILNAVAQSAGASIPDTCAAIHQYTATHAIPNLIIDANAAADIMCVPTRLSGFFYTGIAAGWKWMVAGIGHSAFTLLMGVAFICLFVYNIWKFALVAFGVIADLFLSVFMLPFTAIAETLGKTNYKGLAGNLFNQFMGLFGAESLETQFMRYVNAALYFVSLSIVVGLCAAILSGFMTTDLASQVPTIENMGMLSTFLAGLLVSYLASHADEIVKNLGGSIDSSVGTKIGNDIVNLSKATYKQAKSWQKTYKADKAAKKSK